MKLENFKEPIKYVKFEHPITVLDKTYIGIWYGVYEGNKIFIDFCTNEDVLVMPPSKEFDNDGKKVLYEIWIPEE